jgi:hypothetical protein
MLLKLKLIGIGITPLKTLSQLYLGRKEQYQQGIALSIKKLSGDKKE